MATLKISLDQDLRDEADKVFAAIGLTTEDAVRMFLRQAVLEQRLPLDTSVSRELPTTMVLTQAETIALQKALDAPNTPNSSLRAALQKSSYSIKRLWSQKVTDCSY